MDSFNNDERAFFVFNEEKIMEGLDSSADSMQIKVN